ncbi:hypothetical protein Tco_0644591 [Tanacetum coccineum]
MAAPTASVSADSPEESFRDLIDIVTSPTRGGNAWHTEVFARGAHTGGVEALSDRVKVAEVERATLRATVRLMRVVEMILHNRMRDERQTRIRIERQFASVQESHHQDREDFKKITDFMTSQFRYRPSMRCFMLYVLTSIGEL